MHQFRLDLAYKTIPESSAPRNRLTLLAADGGGWDHEPPRLIDEIVRRTIDGQYGAGHGEAMPQAATPGWE